MRNKVISTVVVLALLFSVVLACSDYVNYRRRTDKISAFRYSECIKRAHEFANIAHGQDVANLQCQRSDNMYFGRVLCNVFPPGDKSPYTISCNEDMCTVYK